MRGPLCPALPYHSALHFAWQFADRVLCTASYVLPTAVAVSKTVRWYQMASRASLEYDYLFKIVLVGDAAVGKTNLLACYTSQVCTVFCLLSRSEELICGTSRYLCLSTCHKAALGVHVHNHTKQLPDVRVEGQ